MKNDFLFKGVILTLLISGLILMFIDLDFRLFSSIDLPNVIALCSICLYSLGQLLYIVFLFRK
jgi:hypothetical protein